MRVTSISIKSCTIWLFVLLIFSGGQSGSASPEDNEAPVITSTPETEGIVGQLYQYDVDASGSPVPTYLLSVYPTGMTIDTETGMISWMPSAIGYYNVTVQAVNSAGSFLQPFVLHISEALVAPSITSSPPTTATTGQSYTYDIEATGNPAPTFSFTQNPSGMSLDPISGYIGWVPTTTGYFDVSLQASNSEGIAEQDFTIRVYEAPVITSIPDTEVVVGEYYSYDVEATGDPAPAFALIVFPDGMTFNHGSGLMEWIPTVSGDYDVTVQAGNPGGTAVQSFVIHVSDVVEAPLITSSPPTSAVVDQYFSYDVIATGLPIPVFTLTEYPSGMTIDSLTGLIEWIPILAGNFSVTVEASNDAGYDQQSFSVSVDQIPVITSQPDTLAVTGVLYTSMVEAIGRPTPTFNLTIFPFGMTINSITGLIQWTPNIAGYHNITVQALNSVGTTELSFIIDVMVAQSPTITSTPSTTASVGQLYSYDVEATGIPDPTYSLTNPPPSMTIDSITGLIQWTPDDTGSFNISVQAKNIQGQFSQGFIIKVIETYQAPLIISSPVLSGIIGQLYIYDVDATGSPIPTFSLIEFPEGMVIDAQTGLIQWTPDVHGILQVSVQAVNSVGNSVQEFSITTSCCGVYTDGYTGNTDCTDDGKRNLADITRLIDRVYVTKAILCCEENGNVDGDEESKINLTDITLLIDHVYVSKEETVLCE